MPYGRIGIYTFEPNGIEAVLARAREELPPMMERQPGFMRYAVARTAENEIVSLSAWETREQAEAAGQALVGWVREHMAPTLQKADNSIGEISFSEQASGKAAKYLRVALYQAKAGRSDEVISRAREGFLPLLRAQPGFVRYTVGKRDDGSLISTSGWESKAQAEAAVEQASTWVRQNVADAIEGVENHVGEVLWSVAR